MILMFWPLFFSHNTTILEKLSLFSKIPQKWTIFQDVYDYHLNLGEKQWLKQVESCFMIPWSSFDTHQTYKRALIREVLWVLSLFYVFFQWRNHLWTWFDLKILMSVIVILGHPDLSSRWNARKSLMEIWLYFGLKFDARKSVK